VEPEDYKNVLVDVHEANAVGVLMTNMGKRDKLISPSADTQNFSYDPQYLERIGFSHDRLSHFYESMEPGLERDTMRLVYEMAFKEGFERLRRGCWDGYGRKPKNICIPRN